MPNHQAGKISFVSVFLFRDQQHGRVRHFFIAWRAVSRCRQLEPGLDSAGGIGSLGNGLLLCRDGASLFGEWRGLVLYLQRVWPILGL